MKQITKALVAISGALLITGGAVVNFLQARKPPLTPQEELTLANIEALAKVENIGGENVWNVTPLDDEGSKLCERGGTAFCLF